MDRTIVLYLLHRRLVGSKLFEYKYELVNPSQASTVPMVRSVSGLLQRLPALSELLPVYAVIQFPIFGWTITSWLWKLPSWLNFLTMGEITSILFYAILTAFLEGVLLCGLLVILSLILPASVFRDHFVARGTWLALGLMLSVFGHGIWRGVTRFTYGEVSLLAWSAVSLVPVAALTILAGRVRFLRMAAEWISDRSLIFLYILVPLSVLSVIVIFLRNAFPG